MARRRGLWRGSHEGVADDDDDDDAPGRDADGSRTGGRRSKPPVGERAHRRCCAPPVLTSTRRSGAGSTAGSARARHAGTGGALACRLVRRRANRGTGVARGRRTPTTARVDDANEGRGDVGAGIVATGASDAAGGARAATRETRNATRAPRGASEEEVESSKCHPSSAQHAPFDGRPKSREYDKLVEGRPPALSRPDPPPTLSRHFSALGIPARASRDACASRRGRARTSRAASRRADPRGRSDSGSRRGRP